MRRIDWLILAAGLTTAIAWTLFSSRTGFKGSNAMIIARSISITSTISGQVENHPPEVGTRVGPDDLLVRIHNERFDHGRQAELDSEMAFLQHEIASVNLQQQQLAEQLLDFQEKAAAHKRWMLQDVKLRSRENQQLLEIARGQRKLRVDQAARATRLHNDNHTSTVSMDTANIEAAVAASQVELNQTKLERNELLHAVIEKSGLFFDNGDASYWDKMVDSLSLRHVDNVSRIATLNAQITRIQAQANVEYSRIGSTVAEDHRAPFQGMVNATYVAKGTRVTSGTSLLQVLDCSDPVVLVPLPEHRMGEFEVGMAATIYPVDTDGKLSGTVEYISSGPLIGNDQTLFVQEAITTSGVHAVIGIDGDNEYRKATQGCESARRAVVIIHTRTHIISRAMSHEESGPNHLRAGITN